MPTKAHMPKIVKSNTGCRMFIRCQSEVTMMPARVATSVANNIGMNTSVGCAAPYDARKARMVVGMMGNAKILFAYLIALLVALISA